MASSQKSWKYCFHIAHFFNMYLVHRKKLNMIKLRIRAMKWGTSQPKPQVKNVSKPLVPPGTTADRTGSKKSFGGKVFPWSIIFEHAIQKYQAYISTRVFLRKQGDIQIASETAVIQPWWNARERLVRAASWILQHSVWRWLWPSHWVHFT